MFFAIYISSLIFKHWLETFYQELPLTIFFVWIHDWRSLVNWNNYYDSHFATFFCFHPHFFLESVIRYVRANCCQNLTNQSNVTHFQLFLCVKTYRCATWLNFHYTQKGFPKGSKRHKIFTLLAMYLRKSEFYVHILSPKTLLRFFCKQYHATE